MSNLTPQQATFVAACAAGQSLAVNAVAGSGKTFVLQKGAAQIRGSGISTSFSKATVEELARRMPSQFPATTLHALGFRAIKASNPRAKVDSRASHLEEHIRAALKSLDESWSLVSPIRKLVEHAQLAGIVPDRPKFLLEDTPQNWEELADTYDITFSPLIHRLAREALIASNQHALSTGSVTFPQMMTLPLFFSLRVPQSPVIICDETQDLSPIQHALLHRALRQGGRLIAAGDPHQAVYSFAGAMHDSYSQLIRAFDCVEYPLTVSWRCDQAIIEEAQQYVPHIEAAPTAALGEVIRHNHLRLGEVPPVVICRNNAPITRLALRLLVAGISAEVAGRDVGTGLLSLTKRLASSKTSDAMSSQDFLLRLNQWAEKEVARKPRSSSRVRDKVEALEAFAEHHETLGGIRQHIAELFVDPSGERRPADIHLSTIHKFKGREADSILFLDPHLLPSKWAEKDWEIQSERNLQYVAVTRARHTLHYCSSDSIA